MTNRPPFKRNIEGTRLYYDVLSSKGDHYYEVEMLGTTAISCECVSHVKFKKPCRHKEKAEKAEVEFQASQKSIATSKEKTLEERFLAAPLNGDRSFSLTKR